MAVETIYKLEPHRTMHLRGVDRFGAMGALWGASATGFSLSGVFRDFADFAILMLWDADDYFGHYESTKYLPDFDFSSMVLQFTLHSTGCQQMDSTAFQWIPWRSLSYQLATGQPGTIDLAPYTTLASGTVTKASGSTTLSYSTPTYGDRITLWYQNVAFYYDVLGGPGSSATYFFNNVGATPSFTIDGHSFSYTVTTPGGDSGATVASTLAGLANGYHGVQCTAVSNAIVFQAASGTNTGAIANVQGYLLWLVHDYTTFLAANLVAQINAFSWGAAALPLSATASTGTITVTCAVAGIDGNTITLYTTSNTGNITASPTSFPLTGGVSNGTWNVSIDFSALGINNLRSAWLTFAPQLTPGAFADTEFLVTVTNWAVSDPLSKRALKITGKGSVRVDSRSAWTKYSGASWQEEASNQPGGTGWYSRGFAHRMGAISNTYSGNSVTINYSTQSVHDLFVGTSLYTDRGKVSVTINGTSYADLDCFYNGALAPVVTRRLLASSLPAGSYTVVLTLKNTNHTSGGVWDANSAGYYFYFDYLEAAAKNDVPDPALTYSHVNVATDYDTDHSYKLSPQRLIWLMQRIGLSGEINHYVGVFWWAQRKRTGAYSFPVAVVTIGGTWVNGDSAFVTIDGTTNYGKSVFTGDNNAAIANAIAYFINESSIGIYASVVGSVITITNRTPEFSFAITVSNGGSAAGTITKTGALNGGVEGTWTIDDTVAPVINRAATDWHTDFWAQVHSLGLTGVASFSMELVNPPDAVGHVFAQRYADGTAVTTDTGFGGLKSTQCTFNSIMLAYQKQAYKEMAAMMNSAGLTPYLQFGEFLWWFFAKLNQFPIGAASWTAPINIGTATAHGLNTGEKVVITGVLGNTAANGAWTVTVVSSTHFTLNGSSGSGNYTGGGSITGGGMAYYDADTAAAAPGVTGHSLAQFSYPNDDPSVNSYSDANFLRGLIYTHTAAIATFVKATYGSAKFEVLWPYDVNYPSLTKIAGLGGQLNRYVNLPSQWFTKSGSGLNRMKMEALAFGATERSVALASEAIKFPYTSPLNWSKSDTAYLMPIFNGGCPITTEYLLALNNLTPDIFMWAADHFFLLSWPVPLPVNSNTSSIGGQ